MYAIRSYYVLWRAPGIQPSLTELSPGQIAEELGMDQANPEGMLFPDTYFYSRGTWLR